MTVARKAFSIQLRLAAATLLILPLFLGVTAWLLDGAFARYQADAQAERLRLLQLLLARAAEWDGRNWQVGALEESRLELLNSGLYALLLTPAGELLWSSPSAAQIDELDEPAAALAGAVLQTGLLDTALGERQVQACELNGDYYCQATRIAWGSSGPEAQFVIVESQSDIIAARMTYRTNLLALLLTAALLLLLAQAVVIRWGLMPLRSIAQAVDRLQSGEQEELGGAFPPELVPLTRNINLLLNSEKRRRERVRNTMDRLAHVLKTPLMVIRNSDDSAADFGPLVQEQVDRMLGVVETGLTRARLDGRAPDLLGRPVPVAPVLKRIVDAYGRLPRPGTGEALEIDTSAVAPRVHFLGEEPDLQDLFGSILENSIKHCRRRIQVTAELEGESLRLAVGGDGDGIPAGYESEILRRGARADTANLGHGLGLAIVVEIISAYGGSLHTDHSPLGGALFVVRLPGSAAD